MLLGATPKRSEPLTVPEINDSYLSYHDAKSWNETKANLGGYGTPTAGFYSLSAKGQKPYGAENQGPALDKNFVLDMSDKERFMVVQVLPYSNYTQATANEVFTMTVGAYAWNETNVFGDLAIRPADCIVVDNGASANKATLAAASFVAALCLY